MSQYKLGDVFKVEAVYMPPNAEEPEHCLVFQVPGHTEASYMPIPAENDILLQRIRSAGKAYVELKVISRDSTDMVFRIGGISALDGLH